MCGIAGYYGQRHIEASAIDATLSLMGRRGPDHADHRHFENRVGRHVHLLHSRLSIIDLDERASQPFSLGQRTIVFNGEIYNYVELRAQLAESGFRPRTSSDTEILVAALETMGLDALDRAEGMWAFASYDERNGQLLLSRDRFGEKPLYMFRDETGLYFGSEVKFLAALTGRRFDVNLDHLRRYLVNGYKALYKEERGFFAGVTELTAASFLTIGPGGEEKTARYWTPRIAPDEKMTRAEAVEGTRDRLIQSVKLRLRADVPLAFCMSGGIDSNALISIAKNRLGYDVHGFTIANSDARYEESELVEHAVRTQKLRHTSIPTDTSAFLPKLRKLIRQHDAPVYTITYYAHWLLMESVAAHGYRISVSGTAADELFSGYYDHHLAYLYEVREDADLFARSLRAWEEHIRPVVRNPFLSNPRLFIENPDFRDHIFLDAKGFAEFLTSSWAEPFAERKYADSLMQNRMLNELFHESVPVILHEDDLNAMYFSIENRSPFLDRELFEFAYRIPPRHLLRDGAAKSVLRDSMRGIVPDPILDSRRKVGFNAPIFDFLDVKDTDVRGAILDRSPIFDLVRRDRIEALLAKDFLPNSQSKFLFYFLCSKMFLEEFAS